VARAARPTATLIEAENADAPPRITKKDKRKIKHTVLISRIEKSASKIQKKRRPNKKLVANLESLADALTGIDDVEAKGEVEVGQAKIQRKSLRSRPGAMKRKEKLEKVEKERFNQNLVQLASGSRTGAIQDRWAALKNHVQSTIEVKPEFAQKAEMT